LELCRFHAGSLQDEIAKKVCSLRRKTSRRRYEIEFGHTKCDRERFLDSKSGDNESDSRLIIKEVIAVCRDKYSSIKRAPIGHLVVEHMHKKRAMLSQTDTKAKVPLADHN
jgi:hypothetical protein